MSEQTESEAQTWATVARIVAREPAMELCRHGDLDHGSDEGYFDGVQYLIVVRQEATRMAGDVAPLTDDSLVVPVVPTRWGGLVVRMDETENPLRWIDLGDVGPGTVEEALTAAKMRAVPEINRLRP